MRPSCPSEAGARSCQGLSIPGQGIPIFLQDHSVFHGTSPSLWAFAPFSLSSNGLLLIPCGVFLSSCQITCGFGWTWPWMDFRHPFNFWPVSWNSLVQNSKRDILTDPVLFPPLHLRFHVMGHWGAFRSLGWSSPPSWTGMGAYAPCSV